MKDFETNQKVVNSSKEKKNPKSTSPISDNIKAVQFLNKLKFIQKNIKKSILNQKLGEVHFI